MEGRGGEGVCGEIQGKTFFFFLSSRRRFCGRDLERAVLLLWKQQTKQIELGDCGMHTLANTPTSVWLFGSIRRAVIKLMAGNLFSQRWVFAHV